MRVRRLFTTLSVPALVLAGLAAGAAPVAAAVCDGATTSLTNGTFETPVVPAGTYASLPAADVPPWQTTDGLGEVELWGTGFLGVPAFEGNGFAELNANTAGTLYQDVVSTPGELMTWTLAHRAREGDDTMVVLIGDASTADVNSPTGWDFISAPLTDGVDAWGTHAGSFVVPAGETCTRLAFRAISTGSGSDSVGNFLDAIDFAITVPPTPGPDPTDPPAPVPTPPPTDAGTPADSATMSDLPAALAVVLAGLVGIGFVSRRRVRS